MPKTRKQKEESVAGLTGLLESATNVTFATFNKLKVADERLLRKSLRELGASYIVAKKTLFALALKALGFEVPKIEGQLSIAYSADAIAPARGIAEFAKKHEGVMSIVGGILEGKLIDASKMSMIAAIPPRQTLLAMLANVLNSPIQRIALALDAVAKKSST